MKQPAYAEDPLLIYRINRGQGAYSAFDHYRITGFDIWDELEPLSSPHGEEIELWRNLHLQGQIPEAVLADLTALVLGPEAAPIDNALPALAERYPAHALKFAYDRLAPELLLTLAHRMPYYALRYLGAWLAASAPMVFKACVYREPIAALKYARERLSGEEHAYCIEAIESGQAELCRHG